MLYAADIKRDRRFINRRRIGRPTMYIRFPRNYGLYNPIRNPVFDQAGSVWGQVGWARHYSSNSSNCREKTSLGIQFQLVCGFNPAEKYQEKLGASQIQAWHWHIKLGNHQPRISAPKPPWWIISSLWQTNIHLEAIWKPIEFDDSSMGNLKWKYII